MREASPRGSRPRRARCHFFTLPSMNTMSTAAAPRSRRRPRRCPHKPVVTSSSAISTRSALFADLDRSDLVLAASQSGAIWFYYETT